VKRPLIASATLAVLMAGLIGAWYAVRQEREFQQFVADGNAALGRDDTYGAIEAFSGALALRDDSMLAHLRRGDAYRRRGEFGSALRDLRQATTLDPSAPAPKELSGDVNVAMGRYTRAAEDYKAFVQLDDRSPRLLYKLAIALYRSGQAAEAIAPLKEAVRLDPRLVEAYYLLGVCLREHGDADDARDALQRAVDINPAFAVGREELAALYQASGRHRDAVDQLEALAALEPTRVERLLSIGLAYADWGRTDSAILALARAAERYPDVTAVRVALGRVWLEAAQRDDDNGALDKAIQALQPVASSTSPSAEAMALYGHALLLAGEPSRAERALLSAVGKTPVDPATFRHLADAASRLGHRSTARDALQRYVALVGEDDADSVALEQLSRLQ